MSVGVLLKTPNFLGLLTANTILAAAFPIQLILGGLVGLMLAPSPGLATLPASVQTLAALLVAAPVSLLMGRFGRRMGFALGGVLTTLGALAATQAVFAQSFALLCAAHFLMGAGWSAFQYFRFAAGEVAPPGWRPVAISLMLTSGLVAAIVGPQLFIATKDALLPIPFAGAYLVIAAIGLVGLAPLAIVRLTRPAPAQPSAATPPKGRLAALSALRRRPIRRAIAIAATAQGIMAFLMIPTPIAMIECGFNDTTASDVIRWHIVAMFAPSFVTGFLIKRFGVERIATIGLLTILAAAGSASLGITAAHFYGALIVLGVGWNFAFIGATTMLDAAVSEDEKSAIQGLNDTVIALVSTICAFAAGAVVTLLGWSVLTLVSAGVIVAILAFLMLDRPTVTRSRA